MDKPSIKIAGDGFISPGDYENIKIMGNAKSNGDVKCEDVKINGDAKFSGDLEFRKFKVNGDSDIKGNLKAGNLKVNGNLYVNGSCEIDELIVNGDCKVDCNIKCNNVTIRGDLKLRKNLYAKEIKIYGDSKIEGNIECEAITIQGAINCNGLLNAENVYIYPRGIAYCKEIGATNIEIVKPKDISFFKFKISWDARGSFKGDLIEGDFIKLENVVVKDVRGKDISLISNCEIDSIEYTESLDVSKDSTVGNISKLG